MSTEKLVAELHNRALIAIDRDTLRELIDAADVLREDDTHLAGRIRILALGDSILVQEETPKGEVLARRMASRKSADSFVDLRMQSYERMWDGCGSKVDYYAEGSDGSDDPDRRFRTRGRRALPSGRPLDPDGTCRAADSSRQSPNSPALLRNRPLGNV